MLDVRNAISAILDRYTLADVVEVTTRKMITSGLPLPFSQRAPAPAPRHRGRPGKAPGARTSPTEGVIHQLLGDYAI